MTLPTVRADVMALMRRLSPTFDAQRTWFARAAADAVHWNRFRLIPGRAKGRLYLARFWLADPHTLVGERATGHARDVQYESGDSALLHFIARPDDDGAVHDHPWDFSSTVLCGGYLEQTADGADRREERALPGLARMRRATDLHRIAEVDDDTWTLVLTGRRVRDWGFVPNGGAWTPHAEHLTKGGS